MFDKRERDIYRYYNGEKVVGADPLVIQKKMALSEDCDFELDMKLLPLGNKEALSAFDRLCKASREAFNIKVFEEVEGVQVGLMDSEMMELLVDFALWLADIKKKAVNLPSNVNPGDSE